MFRRLILLLIPAILTIAFLSHPASAQETLQLGQPEANVAFPNVMTFSLPYSGAEPVSATLTYDVEKFTCVTVATDVPVEPDGDGTLEWQWVMSRSGNPPPGTDVTWQWTVVDAAGNVTTTEPQTVTLQDERFDWQTVEGDRITLHWYRGNVGEPLLASAEAGLNRLEDEMGIQLSTDVEFWIYGNASEMRDAVLTISDWAGGVAFTEYNKILIGVPPTSLEWGRRVVAHELAHLVLGQFGRSCVGGARPTWLEEGLAMVAEGEPESTTENDLRNAISADAFAPIRSLTGAFPAHDGGALAAYSQSYSIVDYMLDTYGAGNMQQLVLLLADGESYDDALMQIYGLNMDSLENEWRDAIGAAPRAIPPTLTPIVAEAVPTFPPLSAAQDVPTPDQFSATPFAVEVTPSPVALTAEPSPEASPTATPPAVSAVVPTPAPAQPAPTQPSSNLLLYGVIGVLALAILGLLVFILRP